MGIAPPPTATFELERMELDALLSSGVFSKASSLAQLLTFVCNKYFEGAVSEIKEYNIGVTALNRAASFDPKKDSIVRVEAHRLRKRLREFYAGDGASHRVHIFLPPGQYVPRFVFQESAVPEPEAVEAAAPVEIIEAPPVQPPTGSRRHLWWMAAACAGVLLIFGTALQTFRGHRTKGGKPDVLTASDLAMIPSSAVIRIRAGYTGDPYVDRLGNKWETDRYFQGGEVFESHQQIAGTRDARLYQTRREGNFHYDIPLKSGSYEMRLHFAETVYGENNVAGGGESSRVFSIYANGERIVKDIDVISDAGSNTADIRSFKNISPASDGKLHLAFDTHSNPPILSGIELIPSPAGKIWPIRLIAQDRSYIDDHGQKWEPDRYARGGQVVARTESVSNTPDPELYRGERFGNLQYSIPVPPGQYAIALHFSEAWFGPENPGKGGAGSRVFDILCNGVVLKPGMDIFQEAGGANRAFTWTAHGLSPNPQGKLVITLMPEQNYASINALEVVDESR